MILRWMMKWTKCAIRFLRISSPRVPMRRNVYRGSCESKDFMAFLFCKPWVYSFCNTKSWAPVFPQMLSFAVLVFEDLPLSFQWFEGTPFGNSPGCHKIRTEKDSEKAGSVGKDENQKGCYLPLYRCAGSGSAGPPLCLCTRSCDEAGDGLV